MSFSQFLVNTIWRICIENMLIRLFLWFFSIVINDIKDVWKVKNIKSVENWKKKRMELIITVVFDAAFIFTLYVLQVMLIEIPTPRSLEDVAAGVRRAWRRVSHWCAGCEWGRPPSCYSAGDERVVVCWLKERVCGRSSALRAPFGRTGVILDADRCVVNWCVRAW